jgi:hypothetical protein
MRCRARVGNIPEGRLWRRRCEPAFSTVPAQPSAGAQRVVDNVKNINSIRWLVFAEAVGKLFDAWYPMGPSGAGRWLDGTGNEHLTQNLITVYPQAGDF